VPVFISYSRANEQQAHTLAADLAALGHTVWYDDHLSGGDTWWSKILEAIRECDLMIFVASEAALRSKACLLEFGYARALKKVVVPVLVEKRSSPDLLPEAMRETQFVDYRTDGKDALRDLARSLSALAPPGFARVALPEPLPTPPDAPVTRVASLRDRVALPSLSLDQQKALLHDLITCLESQEDPVSTHELLGMLRHRPDVVLPVARQVDALLRGANEGGWFEARPRVAFTIGGLACLSGAWLVGIAVKETTKHAGAATLLALLVFGAGAYWLVRGYRRAIGASR
jgi:hypothetical protein